MPHVCNLKFCSSCIKVAQNIKGQCVYSFIQETEPKPSAHIDNTESIPSHPKPNSYYAEQDSHKPTRVETRTLSIASVINSQINGIFARDNIASNKPYFPPNFYKQLSSDKQGQAPTKDKSPQSLNTEDRDRKPYGDSNRLSLNTEDIKGYGDRKPYSERLSLNIEDSKSYGDRQPYNDSNRMSLNTEDPKSYDRQPYSDSNRLSLNTEDSKGYVVGDRTINRLPGHDHEANRLPSHVSGDHESNRLPGYDHEPNRLPGYDHSNGYHKQPRVYVGDDDDQMVVSVLDAREAKLRRMRMDGEGESEESGIESEEDGESRLKELLKVSRCPKVKPDLDEKVGFVIICL